MQRLPATLILLSTGLCFARPASGQSPDPTKLNLRSAEVRGVLAAPSSVPSEPWVAEIVLVGNIENAARLTNELAELLSARGFAPNFQQRAALSENELVAQQQPNDPSHGTVWILVPNSTLARLVFADRAHMRFLIRDIPLQQGMDDVGRESVEQIVDSSFLALLQGAAAIGRAEVHAALGADVVSQASMPLAAQPSPWVPAQPHRSVRVNPADTSRISLHLTQRLGVGYAMNWSGGDFGVGHGPEFLAGLELLRRNDSLYVAGAFDLQFAQHHRSSEFDLSLKYSRIWLIIGWRRPISSPFSFVATAGPGVGVTRIRSIAYEGVSAKSNPDSSSVLPFAQFQGGVEWGTSPLVIQLVLRADMSFYDTHLEINRNGVRETLAHPWPLRPGVALSMAWR